MIKIIITGRDKRFLKGYLMPKPSLRKRDSGSNKLIASGIKESIPFPKSEGERYRVI